MPVIDSPVPKGTFMSPQPAQPIRESEAALTEQAPSSGATENVDRIREILFGPHLRDFAQRFHRLEEQLTRETADLRTDVRRQLDALETYTRQEVSALSDRLAAERQARDEDNERIDRDLTQLIKGLEKRQIQTAEQVSKDLSQMRQATLERQQSLIKELTDAIAAADALQKRHLDELRGTAADRFALADLFTEISLRIRGEFRIPGAESTSNARVTY